MPAEQFVYALLLQVALFHAVFRRLGLLQGLQIGMGYRGRRRLRRRIGVTGR